jgi:hypothetical protein
MTCSCPKCSANIEVDLSRISDKGTFLPCPECKGRFWINKESYARMALKKDGNTYCDQCGKKLDHRIVCSSCGIMYPDYYLVQASRPPRRQIEKPNLFSLSFSLKPVKPTYAYTPTYTGTAAKEYRTVAPRPLLKVVGIAAIIILITLGVNALFHKKKAEQQYAKNYIRALYIIKSGTDISIDTCSKISTEWKTNMSAGQNSVPRIKKEDETRLNSIKQSTDKYMQIINNPPKKFIEPKEKLANLYGLFLKANTLAIAPSGSLSGFTNSVNNSQNEFNSAVQLLKKSLPPELSAELKIAKNKYKGFKDI